MTGLAWIFTGVAAIVVLTVAILIADEIRGRRESDR